MKQYPSYDLHCHSLASDGALAPDALVHRAYEAGVRVLALTDHDSLDGLAAAREAAGALDGFRLIDGIELTCLWERRVVHLLGLGVDPEAPGWAEYLANLRRLREERAERIAHKLVKAGLPDLLEVARRNAGDGQIGRPHFAQALVDMGRVSTTQQAFDCWLGWGKVGDVKALWPTLEEAVAQVKRARGFAVIAHPTKYNLTFSRLRTLVKDMLAAGGDGIEVSYPGVTPNHLRDLQLLAEREALWASAGSDFHSPEQRWTALGRFPAFKSTRHLLDVLIPNYTV